MANITLVNVEAGHRKFWKARVIGNLVRFDWGRLGTVGQTLVKSFRSNSEAIRFFDKKVDEKFRKGYVEV